MRKWTPSATDDAIAQDKALLVQAPDFWFNRYFWCKAARTIKGQPEGVNCIRFTQLTHSHRVTTPLTSVKV